MRIRVASFVLYPSGYREFAQYFIAALKGEGHDVTTVDVHPNPNIGYVVWDLKAMANPPEINLLVATPDVFAPRILKGSLNIGFTMFETSLLPPEWVPECNKMDGILVPSEYCRKTFVDSGVTVPVHVVRPGLLKAPLTGSNDDGDYRFLSIFQWGDRKDPTSLLTAYWREFNADERVVLSLKTSDVPNYGIIVEQRLQGIRDTLGLGRSARVEVVQETLTTDNIWRMHATADCYVSTHRGEGWGMPLMDAMAVGKPCIATDYSGNLDFMSSDNSYLIPYQVVPTSVKDPSWQSGIYQSPMEWASIDVPELQKRMRYCFQNRTEALAVGAKARRDILNKLTPAASVKMFESSIQKIRAGVIGQNYEDDRLADSGGTEELGTS